jgi:hypothetical protein
MARKEYTHENTTIVTLAYLKDRLYLFIREASKITTQIHGFFVNLIVINQTVAVLITVISPRQISGVAP